MTLRLATAVFLLLFGVICPRGMCADDLFPPVAKIKPDHPRVLLRPEATRLAVSLGQLRTAERGDDFRQLLAQLAGNQNAAAQAMVYLLSGDESAADKAIARMRAYRYPGEVDTFHIYFTLQEFALAYDWLYDYEGFTDAIKAEIRGRVMPLAQEGLRVADDHVFHNYVWMSAGGTALWALATAGDDEQADRLYGQIAARFNDGLFPAMRYLDGLPSEPMGYWAMYDLTSCALTVLAVQSASETDLVGMIRDRQNAWLDRHFENLVHSTLPDMRYLPWGDMQSGPNGGVTHEMAGTIDAMTWGLGSPHGAYFGRWLADRRGLSRFYGETAIFYMLYTRSLATAPAVPPLGFLAGNRQGGHFIARSSWDDDATIVTLRAADHMGDHNHYDQGSFMIYRHGLLAVDPPVYRQVRGPQQKTEHHNTLLLGGQPQRPVRGQWFKTVEKFEQNLQEGCRLETGDILFHEDAGTWAAVAAQFAQAYPPELVQSCVRQLLFVRPATVVVVDQLTGPASHALPEVQWLLQVPRRPAIDGDALWASNGKSWLRCRPIMLPDEAFGVVTPGAAASKAISPEVAETPVDTHQVRYTYAGKDRLTLVHVLDVGDGDRPGPASGVRVRPTDRGLVLALDGQTFLFATSEPFAVAALPVKP